MSREDIDRSGPQSLFSQPPPEPPPPIDLNQPVSWPLIKEVFWRVPLGLQSTNSSKGDRFLVVRLGLTIGALVVLLMSWLLEKAGVSVHTLRPVIYAGVVVGLIAFTMWKVAGRQSGQRPRPPAKRPVSLAGQTTLGQPLTKRDKQMIPMVFVMLVVLGAGRYADTQTHHRAMWCLLWLGSVTVALLLMVAVSDHLAAKKAGNVDLIKPPGR